MRGPYNQGGTYKGRSVLSRRLDQLLKIWFPTSRQHDPACIIAQLQYGFEVLARWYNGIANFNANFRTLWEPLIGTQQRTRPADDSREDRKVGLCRYPECTEI